MKRPLLAPHALALALVLGAATGTTDAIAADTPLALGTVEASPSAGVDRATLKSTAEGELAGIDASKIRNRRKVIVSVTVTAGTEAPVACTVNATLHDSKTGALLAILEGRARSDAGGTNTDLRKAVLRVAMRNAVRQIPDALAAAR